MAGIIGIHGVGTQFLGRQQLLELWRPALGDGVERAIGRASDGPDLDLVYYGDLFRGRATGIPGGKGMPRQQGQGELEDVLADLEEAELADLVDAAKEVLTEDEIAAAADAQVKAYLRLPGPLRAVAGALGRRFGLAGAVLFFGSLRQVRRYLCDQRVKAAIDGRVAAAMAAGPRVLIGHSLGSVVAYEYVRQHRDAELPLLLTLGSPLGLCTIRGRLGVLEASPDSVAEGLRYVPVRWVNVYDPGDPVACAGGLRSWWPHVADEQVDNGGDAHAVTRYLCTRAVGRAVVSALHDGE